MDVSTFPPTRILTCFFSLSLSLLLANFEQLLRNCLFQERLGNCVSGSPAMTFPNPQYTRLFEFSAGFSSFAGPERAVFVTRFRPLSLFSGIRSGSVILFLRLFVSSFLLFQSSLAFCFMVFSFFCKRNSGYYSLFYVKYGVFSSKYYDIKTTTVKFCGYVFGY